MEMEQGNKSRCVLLATLEKWLRDEAPPAWLEGYLLLRAQGVRYRDAMLATWLSLSTDDRGDVPTREEFANLMGVARATTYQWEGRRPAIRDYAEMLRVIRLRGAKLAEIDQRSFEAAVDAESNASDRKLYYQRAGVWDDESTLRVVGKDDGPVEYTNVMGEELDAIRQALAQAAARSGQAG